MTETLKCRLKKGELELEIEGVADQDLKTQVSALVQIFKDEFEQERVGKKKGRRRQAKVVKEPRVSKPSARAEIQPKVNELIDSGWIKQKTVGDIVTELKRQAVPNVNIQNVTMALKARVPDTLTREKDLHLNRYLYSVK